MGTQVNASQMFWKVTLQHAVRAALSPVSEWVKQSE
jgi:hypothetical protein